jgi:hypothetical protein
MFVRGSSFCRGSSNLGSQKKLGTAFTSNSDLKYEHEGCGFTSVVFCTFISNLDAFHLIVLLLIMNWPFASQMQLWKLLVLLMSCLHWVHAMC